MNNHRFKGSMVFFSGYFEQTGSGLYIAEDFELNTQTSIGAIKVYGWSAFDFQSALRGVNLYLYVDDHGKPDGNPALTNSEIFKVELDKNENGLHISKDQVNNMFLYNFTINTEESTGSPLSLQAGRYWLVAAPQLDADIFNENESNLWFWSASTSINGYEPQIIDPSENIADNEWQNFNEIIDIDGQENGIYAFAFTLYDHPLKMIRHKKSSIEIYPNPVTNYLHIDLPYSLTLQHIQLFNAEGLKIPITIEDNKINVSTLPQGLYFLRIKTAQGILNKKVIKS